MNQTTFWRTCPACNAELRVTGDMAEIVCPCGAEYRVDWWAQQDVNGNPLTPCPEVREQARADKWAKINNLKDLVEA